MQEAERCADLRKELSAERRAKTELGRGLAELRSKERAWRKERQVSLTIACHALPGWLWGRGAQRWWCGQALRDREARLRNQVRAPVMEAQACAPHVDLANLFACSASPLRQSEGCRPSTGAQLREFKTELSDAQVLLAEMREAERSRRGERRMVERQKKAVAARQELAERCV